MLKGINDTAEDAKNLVKLIKEFHQKLILFHLMNGHVHLMNVQKKIVLITLLKLYESRIRKSNQDTKRKRCYGSLWSVKITIYKTEKT